MSIKHFIFNAWQWFNKIFEWLTPVGDLFIRVWIFRVFFYSALTKIESWDSTLELFENEYAVPLLPPDIAAYLGTATELTMPFFILLGLGGRVTALILFLFNIAAAVSYPFLWTPAGEVGLYNHFYWGILLMVLLLHGYGLLSLDQFCKFIYKSFRR